jgi:phage replication-related protein YjqB (UPF0714/DUF867 family)
VLQRVVIYCLAEPRSYEEVLRRGYLRDRDFRVTFGDGKIEQCLLIAPHGGGIEPGTSEIMKSVSDLGNWAWYEFAGFLREGNKDALHITSTCFDEPTLARLLPQTTFVVAFHGASDANEAVVYVGGKWKLGRETIIRSINAASKDHGLRAVDAVEIGAAHLSGLDESNITNRGRLAEGVQMEFSKRSRDLMFPPDSKREARGRRSAQLRLLASSIHDGVGKLCRIGTGPNSARVAGSK